MKGFYYSIDFNDFLNSLKGICLNNKKLLITILTWGNDHYFEELCEEDGGIIQEHLIFLKNMPLGKILGSYADLETILNLAKKIPCLTSKNGNYKVFYDIHILIDRHYFCYDIFHNRCFYRFQNILQHLFGIFIYPEWINEDEYVKEILSQKWREI